MSLKYKFVQNDDVNGCNFVMFGITNVLNLKNLGSKPT